MNENLLLNHLLREGITPSFSFPLDVCEFKAEGRVNGDRHVWPNMQQDLKKALSEFSPRVNSRWREVHPRIIILQPTK